MFWTEGASSHIATISPAKTALAVLIEITAQKSAGISVITLLKLDVIGKITAGITLHLSGGFSDGSKI